jgi:pyruvate dehydrogenase E1 component alpha subunit
MALANPPTIGDLGTDLLLDMYRRMRLIRRFEERAVELYRAGEMRGTMHPAIGQEAVSVGICTALRPDDTITSTHRGHGDVLAKGAAPERVMAELFGRTTGVCKGKGGSMHVADLSIGAVGANGIVGAGIPITNGLALAGKLRGLDRVSVVFFGDGATNQGAFHESLNLGSLWSLPVVYVCQNNQWATCMPRSEHQRAAQVSDFARSYQLPGVTVDGNDVLAVHEAARTAVARARAGEGPTLIDAVTYRWLGHHAGDDHWVYRDRQEVESWYARDPIKAHRARLEVLDGALGEQMDRLDAEIDRQIEAAVEFAAQSPHPAAEEAEEDLYVGLTVR